MATSENWFNRRKGKPGGDLFKLDTKNKSPEENIKEIIQGLYTKTPFPNDTSPTKKHVPTENRSGLRSMQKYGSDSRRLSYLNALVTLLSKEDRSNLGFTAHEIMTCIRVSLVDDSMVMRVAALRVLRYLIKTESDVATFNYLKLPYLVIRSMDLNLRNEEERAQALRVVRRVIAAVGAAGVGSGVLRRRAYVDLGLLRCLAAVARAGSAGDGSGDRLSRPAIATLAEICVLNGELFVGCGGVGAVARQLAECATPRMAEALCGVLLHALDRPAPRRAARLDLTCLSEPYTDFHFRPAGTTTSRDEREMRFTCSRLALLCVLRSWPGLLHFCHPRSAGGLRALVAALYLPRLEVRKAILDLLYELVGLPQPEWTDEISVALDAVDPCDFQDSWRLNEGFVAAEGTAILPHLAATGSDITEIHLALLLQCFLEAGLVEGLAEVIVSSDTFISVRATVLVGQLAGLAGALVPGAAGAGALAPLLAGAAAGGARALAAVAALRRLHARAAARPAAASLFLDHQLACCSGVYRRAPRRAASPSPAPAPEPSRFLDDSDIESEPKRHSVGSRADVAARNVSALVKSKSVTSRTSAAVTKVSKTAKFFNLFERDGDSLIRGTLVMQNKDGNTWNWEIIRTILKENDDTPLLNLNDSGHKAWVGRIINYLKPSSNKYSHADLSSSCHGHTATRAGCQLIRHLLKHDDTDSRRLLEDLFLDVSRQIEAIETGLKAHECLFSPQHMCNTMCQMYFLFIGQLCHSHAGLTLFKQTGLYDNLLELSTKTHHSCYVKLVISSLDYTLDSYPRDILAKTLTCNIQASRLYTTQFLNVLLRASRKSRDLVRRKAKLKKCFAQEFRRDDNDSTVGVDMDSWILQVLVGQVKDESKAIAKIALTILEEAHSVPAYAEKLMTMRDTLCQNCRLDKNADPATFDLSAVGDRGYLLWLSLEVTAAAQSADSNSMAFINRHLDFWTKSYNFRYVRVVESAVQEALSLGAGGRWAGRRAVRPPPHLHRALAAPAHRPHPHPHPHPHSYPHQNPHPNRARAALAAVLPAHYKVVQRKKWSNAQEIAELKASLWALGSAGAVPAGLTLVLGLGAGPGPGPLSGDVARLAAGLAQHCPVYSVRAAAFYMLSLLASTHQGANVLAEMGWLSVRHTRHDQFPLIPDEVFQPDGNPDYLVTSPETRYNAYEGEMSEHSDHTDQSMIDSTHSDTARHLNQSFLDHSDLKEQDVVDYKSAYIEVRREPDKRKSHTLPSHGCSSSLDRATLSESRTVDILKDYTSYERSGPHRTAVAENRLLLARMNSMEHAHEGRVRNTSESSTSGVSSCDSFLGKYAIPDRVLTLSPIPSSSSLYGMKSSNSSQRPRIPEMQRRTSTSSFAGHEVASSPPTQLDMTGYATLKSISRRPHLSESAVSGSSDMDDLSWLLTDTDRRTKPFSSLRDRGKTCRERAVKMSLLEYDWRPLGGAARAGGAAARRGAPLPPAPAAPHPAYIGICLPRDLAQLFPSDEELPEEEEAERSESSKRHRLPSLLMDSSTASIENRSRATPDSQKLAAYKGAEINVRGTYTATMNAIAVAITGVNPSTSTAAVTNNTSTTEGSSGTQLPTTPRAKTALGAPKDKERTTPILTTAISSDKLNTSASAAVRPINDKRNAKPEASTVGVGNNVSAKEELECIEAEDVSVKESLPANAHADVEAGSKWRHVTADCLACVRTRPPSSHELREDFFAGIKTTAGGTSEARNATGSPVAADKRSPQAELLHHVHFMANPIHMKQSRSVLVSLKQRHPEVFRSACVYSEVCALLGRDTYMLCARRFLQEMFLDASFDCFTAEPAAVLARH